MKSERRNGDRYCFNLELQPEGELLLLVAGQTYEVWKLLDISPFGTGLSVDEYIGAEGEVTLQYRCDENDIKVFATVAWSGLENSQEEGGGFRVGLQFNRDEMELNVALFKALTAPVVETRTGAYN